VAVKVRDEDRGPEGPRLAWELVAPSGHAVRVYEGVGEQALQAAIEVVSLRRRKG
jgi:hypothetical protein